MPARSAAVCATAREVARRADECSSLPSNIGYEYTVMSCVGSSVKLAFILETGLDHTTESGGYKWKEGGELNIARVEKHKFCIQVHKKCTILLWSKEEQRLFSTQ